MVMPPPVRSVVLPTKIADALSEMLEAAQTGSFTIHIGRGTPNAWEARATGRIDTRESPDVR